MSTSINRSDALHFPPQGAITTYLKSHPLTKSVDQKAIDAVARVFANKDLFGPQAVALGITKALGDAKDNALNAFTAEQSPTNSSLGVYNQLLMKSVYLNRALVDCAQNVAVDSLVIFRFPTEQVIASLLEGHLAFQRDFLTQDQVFNRRLIQAVAKHFAGKEGVGRIGVELGVMNIIEEVREQLERVGPTTSTGLPTGLVKRISHNLTLALLNSQIVGKENSTPARPVRTKRCTIL